MKPASAASASVHTSLRDTGDDRWRERAGRLFVEFERPAKAMVRRAFRGAFDADELDDIYSGAWIGTLRALAGRHTELADDEVRSYVLTAVANQASKELRRRRRKPTAPLELVGSVPDSGESPEERVASREQSSIARDVLASLPPRRRAVMLLRYGWGLEPSHVCALIEGLSPRAYRKEITRGVDELAAKMRAVESGEWCTDREPLLKSFAAGLADEDERRQARAHLAHCRACAGFVARLSGHLHDVGGSVGAVGAIDGLDGNLALAERLVDLGERVGGLVARGSANGVGEVSGPLIGSGGARGAGVAGAGVLAKLAGVGAAGKLALACVGGGVAVTACIAAGVTPLGGDSKPTPERERTANKHPDPKRAKPVHVAVSPSLAGDEGTAAAPADGAVDSAPAPADREPEPAPEAKAPAPTVEVSAPPEEQEFGVAAAAVPPPPSQSSAPAPGSASPAPEPTEPAQAQQEFGP